MILTPVTTTTATGLAALLLAGCVAPDEVWPDFTDHSPAGYRSNMAAHHLCIKPPVTTIAVLSPSTALVRSGSGWAFNLFSKVDCFESKSVKPIFTPIGPNTDLCVAEDYTVAYTDHAGHPVTCALIAEQPVRDDSLQRDLTAFEPGPNPAPGAWFRYPP